MIAEALITYIMDRKFIVQSVATLGTFLAINIARLFYIRGKRYKIFQYYGIPTEKPSIISGTLYTYKDRTSFFKTDEELAKKHGRYFGAFIGDHPVFMTTDTELLRKIFFEHPQSFTERSLQFIRTPLHDGVLFADHERWRLMRKSMAPYFSKYSVRGETSTQFIEDSVSLMINYIDEKLDQKNADGQSSCIDIYSLMKATALHLISEMAIKLPDIKVTEKQHHVESLDEFLEGSDSFTVRWAIRFPFLLSILQFLADHLEINKTLAVINRQLDKLIESGLSKLSDKSRNQPQASEQLIDTLIRLHHEGRMSKKEVVGNIYTILFAGYDTTATTLTYILWVLGHHCEIQDRLRIDLKAHGIQSTYLEQVINETMRLYPTVVTFTTRLATKTVKIDDLTIPQGTKVTYNAWITHRDPNVWSDPLKFDPDRFKAGASIHPCAFAPFGLSERKCLGYQLAMLEMEMVICDLLLRYRVKLIGPEQLELATSAFALTKPREMVKVEFSRL